MNEMKATGNILSIRVDIPQSEFSIFEFLAQKMGWKIRSEKEDKKKNWKKKKNSFLLTQNDRWQNRSKNIYQNENSSKRYCRS